MLWARSIRWWDRVTLSQTSEFVDTSTMLESVGGRILLSRDSSQHLRLDPSAATTTIEHKFHQLFPGQAASIVSHEDTLLADDGWSCCGFGSMKKSFLQSAQKTWIRLPSNDVLQATYQTVSIPDWAILLLALILPARFIWARITRRHRRAHPGFCANCGYDLRATPDRCPECGREVLSIRE